MNWERWRVDYAEKKAKIESCRRSGASNNS